MIKVENPHPGLGETHWLHELLTQEEIDSRVDEMAREASMRYRSDNVIFVRVKEGGDKFADLFEESARKYGLVFDSGSITVSSMEGTDSTGNPIVTHEYQGPDMAGRKVVFLEDIADTGETLKFLFDFLSKYSPAIINAIVLFMKSERRNESAWELIKDRIDDAGFDVFGFIVGFNIDWDDYYRELSGLHLVKFPPSNDSDLEEFNNPKLPIRRRSPFVAV